METTAQTMAPPSLSLALAKGSYLSRTIDIEAEERSSVGDNVINTLKFKGEFPRIQSDEYLELIKDKNNKEAVYAVARKYPDRFCIWDVPTTTPSVKTTKEQFKDAWHYEDGEDGAKIPTTNDLLDMLFTYNYIGNAISTHMGLAIQELDVKTTVSRIKKGN